MLLENGDESPGDHLTPNTDEVKKFVVPAQINCCHYRIILFWHINLNTLLTCVLKINQIKIIKKSIKIFT